MLDLKRRATVFLNKCRLLSINGISFNNLGLLINNRLTHILHQSRKPSLLQLPLRESLNFSLRNPVFLTLLRKVQDVS